MADAPRLRAYWGNQKEPLVGVALRGDIDISSLRDDGLPVPFNIARTPIADITKDSVVLASYAWRVDDSRVRLAVFRDDSKDGPNEHVNQNQYDIVTDIERHPKFALMIAPASTSYNGNMRDFCRETIAFTLRTNGDGFTHRLASVPSPTEMVRGSK